MCLRVLFLSRPPGRRLQKCPVWEQQTLRMLGRQGRPETTPRGKPHSWPLCVPSEGQDQGRPHLQPQIPVPWRWATRDQRGAVTLGWAPKGNVGRQTSTPGSPLPAPSPGEAKELGGIPATPTNAPRRQSQEDPNDSPSPPAWAQRPATEREQRQPSVRAGRPGAARWVLCPLPPPPVLQDRNRFRAALCPGSPAGWSPVPSPAWPALQQGQRLPSSLYKPAPGDNVETGVG